MSRLSSLALRIAPLCLVLFCINTPAYAQGLTPELKSSTTSTVPTVTDATQQDLAPVRPVRNWDKPVGPTIADVQSSIYRFEQIMMNSVDGKRHYRVQIGIPKSAPPATGYPVIYMLDGNAALATLTAADLQRLSTRSAPVIVALGYDTQARHDTMARAYDYTPPVSPASKSAEDVMVRGRPGGGADIFLDLIVSQIKPAVQALAPIDRSRQTLWGHSYGGLFTLHTLLTRPELFTRYVAGDPSIWWGNGAVLQSAHTLNPKIDASKTIVMMVGGQRRSGGQVPGEAFESAQSLSKRLAATGAITRYESFPDFSHGQMLEASLRPALDVASEQ